MRPKSCKVESCKCAIFVAAYTKVQLTPSMDRLDGFLAKCMIPTVIPLKRGGGGSLYAHALTIGAKGVYVQAHSLDKGGECRVYAQAHSLTIIFFQWVTFSRVGSISSRWRMSMDSNLDGLQQGRLILELLLAPSSSRWDFKWSSDWSSEWSLRGR